MERFLTKKQAAERVGYGAAHLMRMANDPDSGFPQPLRVGKRRIVFVESEIEQWMAHQMETARGGCDQPEYLKRRVAE